MAELIQPPQPMMQPPQAAQGMGVQGMFPQPHPAMPYQGPLDPSMVQQPPQITPTQALPTEGWGQPSEFDALFEQAGAAYGIDPRLLKAVAFQESGFNPNAVGSKGEQGMMQFMPRTAQSMGVVDPFNPQQAVYGAAGYLNSLYGRFQDPWQSVAAYNMGPTGLVQAGGDYMGTAAQPYVEGIQGMYGQGNPWEYDPQSAQVGAQQGQVQGQESAAMQPSTNVPAQQPQPQQPQLSAPASTAGQLTPAEQFLQQQYLQQQQQQQQGGGWGFKAGWRDFRNNPMTGAIMSQLLLGDVAGANQMIMQRQAAQQAQRTQLADVASRQVTAQESRNERTDYRDQQYVNRVRAKLRDTGFLSEFERDNGAVDTRQQAEAAENYMAERVSEEKSAKKKADTIGTFAKKPSAIPGKLTGDTLRWYESDEQFRETVDNLRTEGKRKEEEDANLHALRVERARQVIAQANKAIAGLPRHVQMRWRLLLKKYDAAVRQERELMKEERHLTPIVEYASEDSPYGRQLDSIKSDLEGTRSLLDEIDLSLEGLLAGDENASPDVKPRTTRSSTNAPLTQRDIEMESAIRAKRSQ